jgi:phytoene dehydrogenase-like protein
MSEKHVIIVGGGLAGLSAGCYARRNGFRTTIIEHNLALGGVCTAWPRGPYTIDGCIHWLTGGSFDQLYNELGILPRVPVRVLETWATYRDVRDGLEIPITRDLDLLVKLLSSISPEDAEELHRVRRAAEDVAAMKPPIDSPELAGLRDKLESFWEMRDAIPSLVHFRKPIGAWTQEHLVNPRLRQFFTRILWETAPAYFLAMVLGYLERGYLSRPVGGTAAFRDALVDTYRGLGGEAVTHTTVDEVLVDAGRATGVRLTDGTIVSGDLVISTSSAPETVLRLLGGRYEASATRERLAKWRLFDPVVLASFGVERPFADSPALLLLNGIEPFDVGGRVNDDLYVRVCNDDPCFAPAGHTVIQAMIPTDYEWWATRGADYGNAKQAVAEAVLAKLEPSFPGLTSALRMTDVATPLTFWTMARSWRGAYEGWVPTGQSFPTSPSKKLSGLDGFYMAGQWVEPGGGVPLAVLSGRQAVQLMCHDEGRPFTT